MAKELYVGSLPYETTEYELEKLFSVSGRVTSIHLILDTQTGRFMGCGYVRMSTEAEAKDAIATLDGALFLSKKITVSIANPQKQKGQGGYKGKGAGAPKTGGTARKSAPPKAAGAAKKSAAPKAGGAAKQNAAPKAGGAVKQSAAPKAAGSAARAAAGVKPVSKGPASKTGAPKPAARRPVAKSAPKKG